MKEFKFVPKAAKPGADGSPAKFEGHITLNVPPFGKRYALIEESGFEMDQSGEARAALKNFGPLVKLAANAGSLVKDVRLKKLASEGESESDISSFEALTEDPDCDEILFELGALILSGFRVSKN